MPSETRTSSSPVLSGTTASKITWGWPDNIVGLDRWTEVALVRSGFGRPTTPKDGETIFRSTRAEIKQDYLVIRCHGGAVPCAHDLR